MDEPTQSPKLIKRYAGSRLYDTQAGRYVDLEDIADMVRAQQNVLVRDANTGRDITQAVLGWVIAGNH